MRVAIAAISAAVMEVLWLFLNRTRYGLWMRAVVQDREMAVAPGIPFFADLFYQTFLTEVLVWALFALSFDLIFGFVGLLSFGQALFFGLGGYAVAIPILRWISA